MKQIFISFFLIVFFTSKSVSQNLPYRKTLSYELGKTGLIHNLYFDNKLSNSSYGYRVGIGNNLGSYLYLGKVSIGTYKLFGSKNKFFELGIDVDKILVSKDSDDQIGLGNFVYPNYTTDVIVPNFNIGYRSYSQKGRLFRIGLSACIISNSVFLGGYLSFSIKKYR